MTKKKLNKEDQKKDSNELHLNQKYYEELDSCDVYSEEMRIGKVFGAKDKNKDELMIKALSKSKRPYGWRANFGFSIYNSLQLDKLLNALKRIARKLGWKVSEPGQNLEKIKKSLREQEEKIIDLQQANNEARINHERLLAAFKEQQEKQLKSRIDEFKQTIEELKQKIENVNLRKIPENELQEFLYKNHWLFGTEYVNAEPQKLRGAHSKFDFYLERFNKTNDIIEIKLLSDQIINSDGTISAKVIQAVDQLIEYLESSIAAAHSTVIAEEEGIRELRPKGIVIIGKDDSKESREKINKWNYRLAHVKILTYTDIVKMGEAVLKHIEKQEGGE